MKQKNWYRKRRNRISAWLLACVMMMTMCLPVAAADYQEERTGSIALTLAVTEDGVTTPIPDVLLSLYKVGAVETDGAIRFVLDERLTETGVDFGAMDTSEKVQAAAQKLEAAVGNAGIEAVSARTDLNGKTFFGNLEKGMYLVVQADGQERCRMAPMLLSVPRSEDGVDWKFDIEASPKAELKESPGTLTVEKRVLFAEDGKWVEKNVKDKTYYVSLFLDEKATLPYGEVKSIRIQNGSRGSAVWTELPEGTYYLRETDSKGTALPLGEEFTEADGSKVTCVITVDGEQTTRITYLNGEAPDKSAVVENRYQNPPEKPPVTPPGEDEPPAKTGDDTSVVMWIGLALVAVAVIAAVVMKMRKR